MSDKIITNYCPKSYVSYYCKRFLGQTTKLNSLPAGKTNNHTLFHITNENIKLTNTQCQTFLPLVPSMISSQNYQQSVMENKKDTFRIYYHAITLINVITDLTLGCLDTWLWVYYQALNNSFYMWWMIRSVVEVAANVHKFSVNWYGQHRSFPAD
jgi:hypothetical protein